MAKVGVSMGDLVTIKMDGEKQEAKPIKVKMVKAEKQEAAPVADQGGEMTAVSVKMTKRERDAFKVYCVTHGVQMSEAFAAAVREYMEKHK